MKLKVLLLIISTCTAANCQHFFTGRIIDKESGIGIKNASLAVYDTEDKTKTDSTGSFVLESKRRKPQVVVVHASYETTAFKLVEKEDLILPLPKKVVVLGVLNIHPDEILKTMEEYNCNNADKKNAIHDSAAQNNLAVYAWYPGGNNCFLNEFATALYPYVISKTIKPFEITSITFTVNANGKPKDLVIDKELPHDFLMIINQFFITAKIWDSATQFGEKVPTRQKVFLMYED